MRGIILVRIGILALVLVGLAVLAPVARAEEPTATGWFNITYYPNMISEGGWGCPAGGINGGTETDINHFWPEYTSPFPGVGVSNYMVCWDGWVNFPVGGKWQVHTVNDDGMDVYVDGQIIMNAWYDQGPSLHDGAIDLGAGSHHVIVKMYNRTLGGTACVAWGPYGNPVPWWKCPNQQSAPVVTKPPVPAPQGPIVIQCINCTFPGIPAPKPPVYKPPVYKPPVPAMKVCYYTVQPGDNLYRISLKYGVNYWTIAQYNGLWNPDWIYVGMVLKIPYCKF